MPRMWPHGACPISTIGGYADRAVVHVWPRTNPLAGGSGELGRPATVRGCLHDQAQCLHRKLAETGDQIRPTKSLSASPSRPYNTKSFSSRSSSRNDASDIVVSSRLMARTSGSSRRTRTWGRVGWMLDTYCIELLHLLLIILRLCKRQNCQNNDPNTHNFGAIRKHRGRFDAPTAIATNVVGLAHEAQGRLPNTYQIAVFQARFAMEAASIQKNWVWFMPVNRGNSVTFVVIPSRLCPTYRFKGARY